MLNFDLNTKEGKKVHNFAVSLLNSTHYFVMKIPNKRHFQQIVFNHSSDIYFQDFMNLYKKCTE